MVPWVRWSRALRKPSVQVRMATLRAATTETPRSKGCLEGWRAREQGGRGTYGTPRKDEAPAPQPARATHPNDHTKEPHPYGTNEQENPHELLSQDLHAHLHMC